MAADTLLADMLDAAEDRLNTNIATIDAAYTAADVEWHGVRFDILPSTISFMRITLDILGNRQAALGGTERLDGQVQLSFFGRPSHGVDQSRKVMQRADAARGLFPMGLNLAAGGRTMRFQAPIPEPPLDEVDDFFHQPLICPFSVDLT